MGSEERLFIRSFVGSFRTLFASSRVLMSNSKWVEIGGYFYLGENKVTRSLLGGVRHEVESDRTVVAEALHFCAAVLKEGKPFHPARELKVGGEVA